jgi:hypothetical protein|tara:strand:+ start:1510 stop:1764 length:255 start_codon:yes stop_codon:yes gene_type:complete
MNKGFEILLGRIESHPDEFNTFSERPRVSRRWLKFVRVILDPDRSGFVSDEQRARFKKEFEKVQSDAFTSEVLAVLLDDSNATT